MTNNNTSQKGYEDGMGYHMSDLVWSLLSEEEFKLSMAYSGSHHKPKNSPLNKKHLKQRISVATPSPYQYSFVFQQDEWQQQHRMITLYLYYWSSNLLFRYIEYKVVNRSRAHTHKECSAGGNITSPSTFEARYTGLEKTVWIVQTLVKPYNIATIAL